MKVPTQSKRFYSSLPIAIAATIGITTICDISVARPRGGGGGFRGIAPGNVGAPARGGGGNNQFSRPAPRAEQSGQSPIPRVEQFQQRVQEIKNSPQFQQRVQEIKANPQSEQSQTQVQQFRQRVQEIKNNPQFQQRVQEIRQNIQNNPEAQQKLQQFQQSRQQFKVERREDWQNYLEDTRDERQDNRYHYNPYYWNVSYGYDYFWNGYYPNYFVPYSSLSLNLFTNDFDDRSSYDSGRYYTVPGDRNYESQGAKVSSLPEGFISVALDSLTYFYYLGTFYLRDSTTGNYAVTPAPVGAVVPYIPTEYQKVTINGEQYYQYAGIYYRPTYVNGQLLYKVVKV